MTYGALYSYRKSSALERCLQSDRSRRCLVLDLEYPFARRLATKLEQAYAILVPDSARRVGAAAQLRGATHEDSRDLRPSLLGPAEGKEHHCQSERRVGRVCQK